MKKTKLLTFIPLLAMLVLGACNQPARSNVDKVTVDKTTASAKVGQSVELLPTVHAVDGTKEVSKALTVTVSDSTIVSVAATAESGKAVSVEGLKVGTADITFTSVEDTTKFAKCSFVVKDEAVPVTITFSHRNSQTVSTLVDTFISEFQAVPGNEHITIVNNKVAGDYNALRDQVVSDMGTGEYPDLVECYPDHVVRYDEFGKVVDLTPYINDTVNGWSEDDQDDLVETFLEEGKSYPTEGIYSLPLSKSTEAMYYNETILLEPTLGPALHAIDEAVPSVINHEYLNDLTWEHLFEHLGPAILKHNDNLPEGEKIIDTKSEHYGVVGYDSDDNFFITLCEQYGYGYTSIDRTTGKGVLDFNNDNVKGLLKKLNGYHADHILSTKGTAGNNYINTYFTQNAFLFSIGSTAGSKYQQQNFTDSVNVANIPHAEGKELKVINQGPSVAILTHGDKNRELAAWKFYKFMAEKNNNLRWAITSGYMPFRKSVATTDEYAEYCNAAGQAEASVERLNALVANYCVNTADYFYSNVTFKGSSTCRSQVGALMTQVLSKDKAECTKEFIDAQFLAAINKIELDMQ